jgi:hypothetical protein
MVSLEKCLNPTIDMTNPTNESMVKLAVKNPFILVVTLFSTIGGLLFGYDQGVVSGILTMETLPTISQNFISMPDTRDGLCPLSCCVLGSDLFSTVHLLTRLVANVLPWWHASSL